MRRETKKKKTTKTPAAAKKPAGKAMAKKAAAKSAAKAPARKAVATKAAAKSAAKAPARKAVAKKAAAKSAAKAPAPKSVATKAAAKGAAPADEAVGPKTAATNLDARKPARKPTAKKAVATNAATADAGVASATTSASAPVAKREPRRSKRPAAPPADRSQARKAGVSELDWPAFALAARAVAGKVARSFEPEVVIGVAKGGVYAGEEIASALKLPFFPVRVHSRSRDHGGLAPGAATRMPDEVAGRRVLVVDDIAGTGTSLGVARDAAIEGGAAEVRTAAISMREGGFRPDFWELESNDLLLFPWDYEPTTGAVGSFGDEDPGEAGI